MQINGVTIDLADYASGSTEPWVVAILGALAAGTNARNILELGAYEGRTTAWLARAVPGAAITAVEADATRCINIRTQLAADALTNVTVVHDDAIHFLRTYIGPDFDFVFVDDDHDYIHVANELACLMPHLAPGAVVCLHDVVGQFNLGPLVRQYDGIILNTPLLHAAGGLGIISMPGALTNRFGAYVRVAKPDPAAP